MAAADLVRFSRDGDQFHYVWAARQCLSLLPGHGDLVAVTIEGPSAGELPGASIEPGEELIDVGFYHGSEVLEEAVAVRYVQLKHSTRLTAEPWTASGLEKTIKGFAKRYSELVKKTSAEDVAKRFRFQFLTNRPINAQVLEALEDLASGTPARKKALAAQILEYTGLKGTAVQGFFSQFSVEGEEDSLWIQRNLLVEDIRAYLPTPDYDGPVQLKDLVSRKASSEFAGDPAIRRYDVLHALKVGEDDLFPAPNLIQGVKDAFAREQESEILAEVLRADRPVILHADGGVGKSMLAARLAGSMPVGSQSVVYDCFGDGLYRSAHNWRHRHRDAFTQIANELAARGLCHPLIPTQADAKAYIRAFTHRLTQATTVLTTTDPSAVLCLVIDAADNAEMATRDQNEPSSFVRDLIRMPLPPAVRLVFTCRSHRRNYLDAPPGTRQVELKPFSIVETAEHLRRDYPAATAAEIAEFSHLSSHNPRVQAMAIALKRPLAEMLQTLGPNPTTIEAAIGGLLSDAVVKLKDRVGGVDAKQIDQICQGLAVLRPLVPIPVLEQLTGVDGGAIRSFAFDLGRPLLVQGDALHFMDEPAETWFRETFMPNKAGFDAFIQRLRPLAEASAYVAAVLPQLLLQAGKHDELVELALSTDALPTDNPLERRDVELQRLIFALKASLHKKSYLAAAKLTLKVAGETAGEDRQTDLLRSNIHLVARLLAPDRALDLASRRLFGTQWMGSHHAYDAVLLSSQPEFQADAASRLRMAMDWLRAWARNSSEVEEDHNQPRIEVTDEDRATLALAHLRVGSAKVAAKFLRSWRHRPSSFSAGGRLARQLVDLGDFKALSALAHGARNNVWLLLALAKTARSAGHRLPAEPLERLLKLLTDRRIQLTESSHWNEKWEVLEAITAAVELALVTLPPQAAHWAGLIRRYLPEKPPSAFVSRFPYDRAGLLKAYALEAALRGKVLLLTDVAPEEIRRELEREPKPQSMSQDAETFLSEIGGLLPWTTLSARISCGRPPDDLSAAITTAIAEGGIANRRFYDDDGQLRNAVADLWIGRLADSGLTDTKSVEAFNAWRSDDHAANLWPGTLISLCRRAARTEGLTDLAFELAAEVHAMLAGSREDAQTRTDSYLQLARAIFPASSAEANAYLDEAIVIASRIGEENLHRWSALLHLANAAAEPDNPRAKTAYRLSRMAELTYEYVVRDKHFAWDETAKALSKLCPSSALAIFSRWRDRGFGDPGRLLPKTINRFVKKGVLSPLAPVVLAGLEARWSRATDLEHFLEVETCPEQRRKGAEVAYRYLRLDVTEGDAWERLRATVAKEGWTGLDVERIQKAKLGACATSVLPIAPLLPMSDAHATGAPSETPERRRPVWNEVFDSVDVTSVESLQTAYRRARSYDPPFEIETFWREAAARTPSGREAELMGAFADGPEGSIFTLHYALNSFPAAWRKRLAFRQALRAAILAFCQRTPQHVHRRGWMRTIAFEELFAEGILTDADVVQAMLRGFIDTLDILDAGSLFHLIDPLSACITAQEADQAVHYGLDLMEPNLKAEDGDGPWTPVLSPPSDLVEALAGYIWAGLGSPATSDRWTFAHVVRNAVEMGWTPLLTALAARASSGVPGPFADAGLVFYIWHARQWLALGLARGALEAPSNLSPFIPWLRTMVSGMHVVVAEFAAQALRAWAQTPAGAGEDVTVLADVNRPRQPETVYDGWRKEKSAIPDAPLEGEDKYYFGHDIGQYWLAPMGRAFGLDQTAVERRALIAIRRQLDWSGRSWRDDVRHKRKIFRDGEAHHSHGSLPKVDDLSSYHGYHAMMLTAGVLLREASVGRRADETQNDFEEWMERYRLTRPDGRWLFDRADPAIVRTPTSLESYDADWPWLVDLAHLDAQLTAPDGRPVLWGDWTAGVDDRRENVTVRTALVSDASASALLAALQTAPDLSRHYLPMADHDEDVVIAGARLAGWVLDESLERGLDERDPWSERLRFPAAVPGALVRERLLMEGDLDGRVWRDPSGTSLLSESWTVRHGYGRETETDPCWRLSADPAFIPSLLAAFPGDCLIFSVKIRRSPSRSGRSEFEAYPWPYVRFYLMRSDGVPNPL